MLQILVITQQYSHQDSTSDNRPRSVPALELCGCYPITVNHTKQGRVKCRRHSTVPTVPTQRAILEEGRWKKVLPSKVCIKSVTCGSMYLKH